MTKQTAEKATYIARRIRELDRHLMCCQHAEVEPKELDPEFIDVPEYRKRVEKKIADLEAELAAL